MFVCFLFVCLFVFCFVFFGGGWGCYFNWIYLLNSLVRLVHVVQSLFALLNKYIRYKICVEFNNNFKVTHQKRGETWHTSVTMQGPLEQTVAKRSWIFAQIRISNELPKNILKCKADLTAESIGPQNFRLDETNLHQGLRKLSEDGNKAPDESWFCLTEILGNIKRYRTNSDPCKLGSRIKLDDL